jgi:hypothetical protein
MCLDSAAVDSCLHMFTHLSLGPIVGERNPGKDAKIEDNLVVEHRALFSTPTKAGCNAGSVFGF